MRPSPAAHGNPNISRDDDLINTATTAHNYVGCTQGRAHSCTPTSLALNGVGVGIHPPHEIESVAEPCFIISRNARANAPGTDQQRHVTKTTDGPSVAGSKNRAWNERTGSRGFGIATATGGHIQKGVVRGVLRRNVLVEKHGD